MVVRTDLTQVRLRVQGITNFYNNNNNNNNNNITANGLSHGGSGYSACT